MTHVATVYVMSHLIKIPMNPQAIKYSATDDMPTCTSRDPLIVSSTLPTIHDNVEFVVYTSQPELPIIVSR
jgi:hypothetical protein